MKKNIIIIFVILAVLIVTAIFFTLKINQKHRELSLVSYSEIITLLNKNQDAESYMRDHSDFKIKDKIALTRELILAGQNGQSFKEVYQGLELENDRYLRVDLINVLGDRGLITVLDFKTMQTVKAYGIILLQAGTK